MGHLREVIELLKKDYARIKGIDKRQISRKMIKEILQTYDASVLEEKSKQALEESFVKGYRPTKADMKLRRSKPEGLYDVVFINRHTKEKQVLTRKEGITYELAWYYYMFITYYESEKYNELGQYELVEHPKPFLPEETHFGIN